jgi:hypothetical protein
LVELTDPAGNRVAKMRFPFGDRADADAAWQPHHIPHLYDVIV